jgi:two-component system, chemotaxis family, protein-glutamate methylesterase/glutaminase
LGPSLRKRVLIVDDAVVIRKALSDALARDPDLEVVGTASNGRLALAKLQILCPDVILLDIEMPEMNGLETIPEIRKVLPHIPIIMFSTLTERGAEATLDALTLGATDYVTKPSNTDTETSSGGIASELIPKIRSLCHIPAPSQTAPASASRPILKYHHSEARTRPLSSRRARPEVIAIGVSTGGPDALAKLLPGLPAGFPLPVVVAQHMPPIFTMLLAKRLAAKCSVPVRECQSEELLEPGCIWIAPGDFHMVVREEIGLIHLRTHQGPRENFCRPSVDVLFRSVAEVFGAKSLGVVLTGMGQDGLKGCEALCKEDAPVIVQDEESSVVWGMPGFVARAGLAEKILPLDQIGSEIVRRVSPRPVLHPAH